jgi:transcription initiation factor TFIIIB Brf1 subunit/transcription initiation factor TFIIB
VAKCIACQSKDTKKVVTHGYTQYECKQCGEIFDDEDIAFVSGRKSKNKQKFTGKHRGSQMKYGY